MFGESVNFDSDPRFCGLWKTLKFNFYEHGRITFERCCNLWVRHFVDSALVNGTLSAECAFVVSFVFDFGDLSDWNDCEKRHFQAGLGWQWFFVLDIWAMNFSGMSLAKGLNLHLLFNCFEDGLVEMCTLRSIKRCWRSFFDSSAFRALRSINLDLV